MGWTFIKQSAGTDLIGLNPISAPVSPLVDQLIVYDDSAAANRRVSVSQLLSDSIVFPVELPPGFILPFAGNGTIPAGFLLCNGSAVLRSGVSGYAQLFAAIGTFYGVGDGTTTFNLPDLRGYFIRGFGTNVDGTASSTVYGSKQADGIRAHSHRWQYNNPAMFASGGATCPIVNGAGGLAYDVPMVPGTSASETRPANIAMSYCIKF